WYRLQLDLFSKLVATCMEQFRPKTTPPLANPERLNAHCEEVYVVAEQAAFEPTAAAAAAAAPDAGAVAFAGVVLASARSTALR
ncbi:hypothetical protein ONJ45_27670, partial [Salmonella enterica subsp. enterica serovar Virginia]|nr:hypothetical protein [Salmonella enterica subsp. enterica serovar Virginia]